MSFWKKETSTKSINDNFINNSSNDYCTDSLSEDTTNISENKLETSHSDSNPVRSALGAGTVIQGKLSFDTPVSIDGKLSGELFSSETVIIGKASIVDAQIEVRTLIVHGQVTGNIKATEKAIIHNGAILKGTLTTSSLVVEEGAILNCNFQMANKNLPIKNFDTERALTKKTSK